MRNKVIGVIFLAYIFVFSFGYFIVKDRDFSELENRTLSGIPKVTVKSLVNGEFSDMVETYLEDQLPGKDLFVKINTEGRLMLGQTYMNGVYFGENNRMFREYVDCTTQLEKNISYINEFTAANPEFDCTFMLAPNACYIYGEDLPCYVAAMDQSMGMDKAEMQISSDIRFVDCREALLGAKAQLAEKDEADTLYYKTDHHWTMDGAYVCYVELCKALGIEANDISTYTIWQDENEFYGTVFSDAPSFHVSEDYIRIYINPNGVYEVTYADTGKTYDTMYQTDNLEKKDKYTVYLDGNHSNTIIKSNADNDKKLLIVKDSYAHCLVPLLADHYSEIHMVDLRYFHHSISDLAYRENIQDVLFIHNLEFLSTDNNFLWLQ